MRGPAIGLLLLVAAFATVTLVDGSSLFAQSSQRNVRISSPGNAGIGFAEIPLNSYAEARGFVDVGNASVSVPWPGTDDSLSALTLGDMDYTFDDDTQTILFHKVNSVPFVVGGGSQALIVIDWDQTPGEERKAPTISASFDGEYSLEAPIGDGTQTTVTIDGTLSAATDEQEATSSLAQDIHGAESIAAGITFDGSANIATQLGELAEDDGDVTVSLSGTLQTSVADLFTSGTIDTNTDFSFAAEVDANQLALPDAVESTTWNFSMSYEQASPPETTDDVLQVAASGQITLAADVLGPNPVEFDASAEITLGGDDEGFVVGGSVVGGWVNPLGFEGLTVNGAGLEIVGGASPTVTLAGGLEVDGIPFEVEVTAGSAIAASLNVDDVSLGNVAGVLADRVSQPELDLPVEVAGITISGSVGFQAEINDQNETEITALLAATTTFELNDVDHSVDIVVSVDSGNTLLALQLNTNDLTLASFSDQITGPFAGIPIPSGAIVYSANSLESDKVPDSAGPQLQSIFCQAGDECDYEISSGVTIAGRTQLPDALGDLIDTLWIDRDGELIISGTLPLFADEPVDLSVELPPIVPPDGDAAAGTFREGRLSFGLSTNPDSGQTEISLVGQVDLYLPDTCLTDDPNDPASRCSVRMTGADGTSSDFDAVTFQVDATVTLPVNPVSYTHLTLPTIRLV